MMAECCGETPIDRKIEQNAEEQKAVSEDAEESELDSTPDELQAEIDAYDDESDPDILAPLPPAPPRAPSGRPCAQKCRSCPKLPENPLSIPSCRVSTAKLKRQ